MLIKRFFGLKFAGSFATVHSDMLSAGSC